MPGRDPSPAASVGSSLTKLIPPPSWRAIQLARAATFTVFICEYVELFVRRRSFYLPQHELVVCTLLTALIACSLGVALGRRLQLLIPLHWALSQTALRLVREHYHFDYLLLGISFAFLFYPGLWASKSNSSPNAAERLCFALILFLSIELTYADSLAYKLRSLTWLNGSMIWLSAAIPHVSPGRLPPWVEIEWLMRGATYLAFAYEALFPLVLVRGVRSAVATLGIFIHLGIGLFLPIPWFGLGMAAPLLAFLPLGAPPTERSVSNRRGERSSVALKWICGATAAAMVLCQVTLNLNRRRTLLHEVFGVFQHGIYRDFHFEIQTPLFRFLLPAGEPGQPPRSFDERGYTQLTGRAWAIIAFTVRYEEDWEERLLRYLRGFSPLDRAGGKLVISARDVRFWPLDYDPSRRREMEQRAWEPVGQIERLAGSVFQVDWHPGLVQAFGGEAMRQAGDARGRPRQIDLGALDARAPVFLPLQ